MLAIYLFIPPIWKLSGGPLVVTRWPRSGEEEVEIGPGKKEWIQVSRVSRHVLYAIVAAEDGRFFQHHGLDFVEILKSYEINKAKGRYVRGGSTITQQVIKMAFLSPKKSMVRKAREAVGALLCELFFTKDEILEWYINMAEFGDGIYGIRAAARHYFQIEPELLNIEHGANLALVLPSPNGWSKGLRQRRLTDFGHRRYAQIINAMRQGGFITETLWDHALATGDFGRPVKAYWQRKQIDALQEELVDEVIFEEGENPEEVIDGESSQLGQSTLERKNQSSEEKSHLLDLGLPETNEQVNVEEVEEVDESVEDPMAAETSSEATETPPAESVPTGTQSEESHDAE